MRQGLTCLAGGVHVILKEVNTPHSIIIRKEYFKKNFAKKFQQ